MSDQPTRVRFRVFAMAAGASWLMYLHRYAWSVVKPSVARAVPGLDATHLGWLDSAFNGAYALAQVPTGWAGDRFGQRLVLTTAIATWSLVVAVTGLVGTFTGLVVMRIALGLATAGTYPNLSQVTRHWFPIQSRTLVQGAVASLAGRAGGACASLVVASLLMSWLGLDWRQSLLAISLLGLLLAGWLVIDFRNLPSQHQGVNAAEAYLIGQAAAPTSPDADPVVWLSGPQERLTLTMLLSQTFLVTFADNLFAYWLPTYLVEAKGLSAGSMGFYASLPLFGGALGGLCGGGLNDYMIRRTGSRRWGRSSVGILGHLLAMVLIPLSVTFADGRQVMLVLGAAKFFIDWGQPTLWGAVTDVGGRASGTLFGMANMTGAIGAFAAGPLMGAVKQHYGWNWVFWVTAATYLLSIVTWSLLDCSRPLVRDAA